MAGTLGSRSGRGAIVGINVTPMVDVVLVLLVIMMVSATYIVSQQMKVDLPGASNSSAGVQSLANVVVATDGQYRLDDQPVDDRQLVTRVRRLYDGNHDLTVVVTADRVAPHGRVVHAMDLAKGVGVLKFAIGVQAE
jgi:biopolymer transport protein ExbD